MLQTLTMCVPVGNVATPADELLQGGLPCSVQKKNAGTGVKRVSVQGRRVWAHIILQ